MARHKLLTAFTVCCIFFFLAGPQISRADQEVDEILENYKFEEFKIFVDRMNELEIKVSKKEGTINGCYRDCENSRNLSSKPKYDCDALEEGINALKKSIADFESDVDHDLESDDMENLKKALDNGVLGKIDAKIRKLEKEKKTIPKSLKSIKKSLKIKTDINTFVKRKQKKGQKLSKEELTMVNLHERKKGIPEDIKKLKEKKKYLKDASYLKDNKSFSARVEDFYKRLDDLQGKVDEMRKWTCCFDEEAGAFFLPTAIDSGFVTAKMEGRGLAAGYVFDIAMTNISPDPVTVDIPLGTVFTPSDTGYQEMIIGEDYSVDLKPGEKTTLPLTGYCLDAEKLPPATREDNPDLTYHPLDISTLPEQKQSEYSYYATIIETGNELSSEGKYDTPLPPAEEKKTVIQWSIWHIRKPDIYTQEKLGVEITRQFSEAGKPVETPEVKKEIKEGTAKIWSSVNLTLKEARTHNPPLSRIGALPHVALRKHLVRSAGSRWGSILAL